MSNSKPDTHSVAESTVDAATDNPAIGLIVTDDNHDAVVRCVLRARGNGYPVLVTYGTDPPPETLSLLRNLGAQIVAPEAAATAATRSAVLTKAAQQAEFPGLLIHPNADEYIDYGRSVATLEDADAYAVEAVPQATESRTRTVVAIPAYNEERSIASVVSHARQYADEVLVVDDGSDDDTERRANEAGALVLSHEQNRGYGATLRTIFREANRRGADQLVVLDGDGQHDPDDIPKLLIALQESDTDLVIGNRFMGEPPTDLPLYRSVGLWVVNWLTNFGLGTSRDEARIGDTQSGFRAYSADAIQTLAADASVGTGMDASTDILYHAHNAGYRIGEVGTSINYDIEECNSHNPLAHGYVLLRNVMITIAQTRPLLLLGGLGTASLGIGVAGTYWTILLWLQTESFPLGVSLGATAAVLAGIFACFSAIIFHAFNTYAR